MPIEAVNAARFRERSGSPMTMAIGDSLFNGVRSLTINNNLSSLSVPVMVAEGLGETMRAPDYPRAVLFDLEQLIREGISFGKLKNYVANNARQWLDSAPRWSQHGYLFFDNISIASSAINDLLEDRAGDYIVNVPSLTQIIETSESLPGSSIAELYRAINTAFLLNPSGEPDLNDCTPVELVAFRRPKRLLVSIGSNEGLFRGGLNGQYTERVRNNILKIPEKMGNMAESMANEFGDGAVEYVYFTNLIKPSTIANLMPRADPDPLCGCGNYYDEYLSRILGGATGISKEKMQHFDALIAEVNSQVEDIVTSKLGVGGRIVKFVDVNTMSAENDGKHGCTEPEREVVVDNHGTPWRFTNNPITTSLLFGFVRGGLYSLDNMHPTTVGYATLANEILGAIEATEGLQPNRVSMQSAFEADTLLQDIPRSYSLMTAMLNLIGTFGFFGR